MQIRNLLPSEIELFHAIELLGFTSGITHEERLSKVETAIAKIKAINEAVLSNPLLSGQVITPTLDAERIVDGVIQTPIKLAQLKGFSDIVKILIEAGADTSILRSLATEVKSSAEKTELMKACERGDAVTTRKLLSEGADFRVRSSTNNRTALDYAVKGEHIDCVRAMMEVQKFDLAEDQYRNTFQLVIDRKNIEILKVLMQKVVNVNGKTEHNVPPIIMIVKAKFAQAIDVMFEVGANLEEKDSFEKMTALDIARRNKDDACVQALLKRKVEEVIPKHPLTNTPFSQFQSQSCNNNNGPTDKKDKKEEKEQKKKEKEQKKKEKERRQQEEKQRQQDEERRKKATKQREEMFAKYSVSNSR